MKVRVRGREGVTLIEVMIVVVIVGLLAAIAIPAYNNYVTKSRRSDAFTALETVRAAQEMYRAERGFYAGALGSLAGCSATMAGGNYTIENLNRGDPPTTYTIEATPQNKQAGDYAFRIDEDGDQEYLDGGSWKSDKTWEELR
jgi:type IV pilus assembly protein PilE